MTHEYEVHKDRESRKEDTTQRIKEKIAVLELWERDGVPESYEWQERDDPNKKHGYPTNISKLLQWYDSSLEIEVRLDGKKHTVKGVYPVSAVSLDKKFRSGLKGRAIELLESIKNRPTPKQELGRLKSEKRSLEVFTQNLVNQNAELRSELINMEEDFDELNGKNKNLRDRIVELEKELEQARKVRGLARSNRIMR